MISEQQTTQISKRLSLILRHQPQSIGIVLDNSGWTDVGTLLGKVRIAKATLDHVVATNNKKRFAFNEDQTRIRANQGHSVAVELGYQPEKSPQTLYHGTRIDSVRSIRQTGLTKHKRHHVHLSADVATARTVGQRHGKSVVLDIDAKQMSKDHFLFYRSANGVWLTDHVAVQYIRELTNSNLEK